MRRLVLHGSKTGETAWGLTVHLRQGTVSWLRAWSTRPRMAAPVRNAQENEGLIPVTVHPDVIALLAGMAAHCRGEVAA